MTRLVAATVLALGMAGCGLEVQPRTRAASGVDNRTPEALAEAIFAAAKSRNYASLTGIASETADEEVLDIAKVATQGPEFQEMFHQHFSSGRVVGKAHIDGKGGAFVPILFGKMGDKEKLLVMAKSDGGWLFDSMIDAVDQSSPTKLAESIFRAAKTGIYSGMSGIAAPGADGDSKDVAGVATKDAEYQKMFRDYFSTGKVNGEVSLDRDGNAVVPILFGPNGTKNEKLNMVQKDGRWYLQSF